MKKYILVSALLLATVSITSVHAEQDMSDMKMMGEKFNMQMEKAEGMAMKMQKEKSSSKKNQYMDNHMESMKEMMGMMEKMGGMMQSGDGKGMTMGDCLADQSKSVMKNKDMMGKGQGMAGDNGQGGMMMGNMMQMMGGMMGRGEMMQTRMSMMQDMMKQMLEHMEQIETK